MFLEIMDKLQFVFLKRKIMVKVTINEKECIGCSFCESTAPEIFEVDQTDFKCKIKKEDFSPEELKQIEEACDGCPVKAIELNEQ